MLCSGVQRNQAARQVNANAVLSIYLVELESNLSMPKEQGTGVDAVNMIELCLFADHVACTTGKHQ